MSNQEILEKAIQKAIGGGWNRMVVANNPIKYLGDHLPEGGDE